MAFRLGPRELRLNLRDLFQILRPHQPLRIVQRGPQVLLHRGKGLLSRIFGAGLRSIAGLLHALTGAPRGSQEAHTVALDIISKCLRYIPDWPGADARITVALASGEPVLSVLWRTGSRSVRLLRAGPCGASTCADAPGSRRAPEATEHLLNCRSGSAPRLLFSSAGYDPV